MQTLRKSLLGIFLCFSVITAIQISPVHASNPSPLYTTTAIPIGGQSDEQTISASPLHPGTMIDTTRTLTTSLLETQNNWSTYSPQTLGLLCTGGTDESASYGGNGTYYFGPVLCGSNYQLQKTTGDYGTTTALSHYIFATNETYTPWTNLITGPLYICGGGVDLPKIYGDPTPHSTWLYAIGRVGFSFTFAGSCAYTSAIAFEASPDGGASWTIRTAIYNQANYGTMQPMSVSNNGTIYLVSSPLSSGYSVFKSTNHGTSWSDMLDNVEVHSGLGDAPAVAAYNGTIVYVAVQNGSLQNVNVLTSTNAGSTWTTVIVAHTTFPTEQIVQVSPTGRVDVSWIDYDDSGGNNNLADMYYSDSWDNGQTFLTPHQLITPVYLCNGSCSNHNDFYSMTETWGPSLGNSTTYIAWEASTSQSCCGFSLILFQVSFSVPIFTLSTFPASHRFFCSYTLCDPLEYNATLTINAINGFSGTATLVYISGGDGEVTGPSTITIPVGASSANVTITAYQANHSGTYVWTIEGKSSWIVTNATFTISQYATGHNCHQIPCPI